MANGRTDLEEGEELCGEGVCGRGVGAVGQDIGRLCSNADQRRNVL